MNKLTEKGLIEFYDTKFVKNLKEETCFLDGLGLHYEDLSLTDKKIVDEIINNIRDIIIDVSNLIEDDYYDSNFYCFKNIFRRHFLKEDYKNRLDGHYESLYFYEDTFKRVGHVINEYDKKTLEIVKLANLTSVLGYASFIQNQICDDYFLDNVGNYQDKDATFNKDVFDSFVLYNNVLKRKNQER